MNKKDLAEIKKHFSQSDDLLLIRKLSCTMIDSEKNQVCQSIRSYPEIPDEEIGCLYQSLSKVLKGTLGKGLIEYAFPNEMYEEDKSQNILWNLLEKGIEDEEQLEKLTKNIAQNMTYDLPYAIFVAECIYTVFEKDKLGDKRKFDSHEYRFLLGAVCPIESRVDGLIYDEEANSIVRKTEFDRVVAEAPTDGFLYPTFTGRGPDVNHVMYYTQKPKNPNVSFVEDVLGCHFTLSAQEEKETFRAVLDKAVGDELNLHVIAGVNERIQDYAKSFKDDPEPPVITDIQMRDILMDAGVSQERAEAAQNLYKETVEDNFFTASNLTDAKTTFSSTGVTVSISGEASDKVTTRVIDGRKFLMISLEDPEVTVNGFQMKIQ